MFASRGMGAVAIAALSIACGQKGPPLPPLHLVPAAPANVAVSRTGSDAQIRFDIPSTNLNGPGAVAIDRIEVFAATVAAGALRPPNRELLTAKYRVGTIAIKPPPVEGEAPPENAPPDARPSAGERTTFVEPLTEDNMRPVFTTPAPKAPASATALVPLTILPGAPTPVPEVPATSATPGAATQPAAQGILPVVQLPPTTVPTTAAPPLTSAAPAAVQADTPAYAARIYTVRGVTKSGRPGAPSARVELPLVSPPSVPPVPVATATETSIVLTWTPPASEAAIAYNIYKAGGADPINTAPVTEAKFERTGVTFGTEECFALRTVQMVAAIRIESSPSQPICLTPRDTFAPAAPKGFSVVAGTGTMNLGWDANTESDIAGYLVLRGEAPGDTLQPLTPEPIAATSYEDKTVKPGVRYVYAIVAVDKASPPNRSASSVRIEETAR